MTILVTGSAGHLGEALMRLLQAQGAPARGLDLVASPWTDAVGSIGDGALVREAMAGVSAVIHTATLHKPHIFARPARDFLDTNVAGTLTLLEAAVKARVGAFVFVSTTSAFGAVLSPPAGAPAAWITEDVAPVPRNIYGASKQAGETLVELAHRRDGLPAIVLRTSRFFPEADDDPAIAAAYAPDNVQANELLYRRADIADVAQACLIAAERAPALGFGRYIVSATTPFADGDLAGLRVDAPAVVRRLLPECEALYAVRGWRLFPSIDRVYVNARARSELGWKPQVDFVHVLQRLAANEDFHSPLARAVGSRGYGLT